MLAVHIDCESFDFGAILSRVNSFYVYLMYKIMYKIMGGGGLVFQDRYRLDRLALTKKFSQWQSSI